jgi:hypothetical protein
MASTQEPDVHKLKIRVFLRRGDATNLRQETERLQSDNRTEVIEAAKSAVAGANGLGRSVVELYEKRNAGSAVTDSIIAKCKGQSKVVAERFQALHDKASLIMSRASGVRLLKLHIHTRL